MVPHRSGHVSFPEVSERSGGLQLPVDTLKGHAAPRHTTPHPPLVMRGGWRGFAAALVPFEWCGVHIDTCSVGVCVLLTAPSGGWASMSKGYTTVCMGYTARYSAH